MAVASHTRLTDELRSTPVAIELIFVLLLAATTTVAFKFTAEILGACSIAWLAFAYCKRKGGLFLTWRLISLAWLVSLVVTMDFALRSGASWSLRIVPVIQTGHSSVQSRRVESEGAIENRDFIIYERWSFPIPTKKALLLTIPTDRRVETPAAAIFESVFHHQ